MRRVIFVMMLAVLLIAACQPEATPEPTLEPALPESNRSPVANLERLTDQLRDTGLTVEETEEDVSQPFFSVEGRILEVGGEEVQVYIYGDATAAAAEATLVSEDGLTVDEAQVEWETTPHFFSLDNLLILYVGTNETILAGLEDAAGPQFAGG